MTLRLVEFVVAGNEASDLLPVRSPALLRRAPRAPRLLDRPGRGAGGTAAWPCCSNATTASGPPHHVAADAGAENGRTEDGEALAHHDGWVYVFGSHFGSKAGPLRPRRAFVARFREDDAGDRDTVPCTWCATGSGCTGRSTTRSPPPPLTPLPPGDRVRHRFIVETLARGTARAKSWVSRLAEDDLPLNVEAAAFTPAGTVLLGLRFPVTAEGEPILVELAGVAGHVRHRPRSGPGPCGRTR